MVPGAHRCRSEREQGFRISAFDIKIIDRMPCAIARGIRHLPAFGGATQGLETVAEQGAELVIQKTSPVSSVPSMTNRSPDWGSHNTPAS